MCGIVGVFSFNREAPQSAGQLVRQADAIKHRGPDDGAVWVGPGIGLGHRRLSIIDLSHGAQPMFSDDGRLVVVFNGEIYNYIELNEELRARGHRFRTDSDTETLIRAYQEWGEGCVDRLNGMFAFALYDRRDHRLFLARDRLGKKPLYYYQDEERFIFASEIKAILEDPTVPREVEPSAVADYHAFAYVPGPKSIFRKIHKLPAASLAHLDGRGLRIRAYWDVDYAHPDAQTAPGALEAELRELLSDAVRLRLRSDVPFGAFLSGGVDSSLVVALMAGLLDRPVVTQSIGFDQAAFDERRFAREIAERFGTQHDEQVLTPRAGEAVRDLSWFYDEPFGDSSAVPTFRLCEMTRRHLVVALSGDGGDEQFVGYDRYTSAEWVEAKRKTIPAPARGVAEALLPLSFHVTRYFATMRMLHGVAVSVLPSRDRGIYHAGLSQPHRYRELISSDLLQGLGAYDPFDGFARHLRASATDELIPRMQYGDIKTYLCDDILVKVDRASMAHGLEVRCPLLDHRVVELAAKIPVALKNDGTRSKMILKSSISDLIEPSFFERPKQGFAIPLDEWFRTSLSDLCESLFFERRGGRSGLLNPLAIKRMWFEHQRNLVHHGAPLWNAMMFELWYARFIEGSTEFAGSGQTKAVSEAQPTRTIEGPAYA